MTSDDDRDGPVIWRSEPQHRSLANPEPFARTLSVSPAAAGPLWTLPYILSVLGVFSFFCCFFYLLTTFPEHLRELGAGTLEVSIVVGGFAFVPIFLRPLAGRWSDAGRRVLMMRLAMLCFIASFLLMIIVDDIWALFPLRLVQGIGMTAYPTPAGSMVAEIVPLPRRGEGLGFFGLATSVAQLIAPLLGALVAALGGFDAVLVLAAATSALTLLLTAVMREPVTDAPPPPGGLEGLKRLLPRAAVFPSMIFFTGVTLGFGAASTFLPGWGEDAGRDLGEASLFFVFSGAAALVARPLAGRISDRIGRVPVIAPGLLCAAVSMIMLTQAASPAAVWLAGILFGVGLGCGHTGLFALSIDLVPPEQRGGATATFQLAWDLGLGGVIVLGFVGDALSVEFVFWVAAAVAAGSALALLAGRIIGLTRPRAAPARA